MPQLRNHSAIMLTLLSLTTPTSAFLPPSATTLPQCHISRLHSTASTEATVTTTTTAPTDDNEYQRQQVKQSLLNLIGTPSKTYTDPVLACPITKDPLEITVTTPPVIDSSRKGTKLTFSTSTTSYSGKRDTYYDLLPGSTNDDVNSPDLLKETANALRAFLPPPIRAVFSEDYVPMRDLFTSPAVSAAYERGWRQSFSAAGFPGIEKEYELVKEYFEPAVRAQGGAGSVVVDMSCATGLMTRNFATNPSYTRVLGCDYSPSMLEEARRRIKADTSLPAVELIRCDVAQIPMRNDSVTALHAGAAKHCWPDVEGGLKEIYRVLKPGGRYFGSTFLATYFSSLQTAEGGRVPQMQQAFNYFKSTDELKDMLVKAGFDEDKVDVELLGRACVIIRAEK